MALITDLLLRSRSTERELLDGPRLDPIELRRNLREMATLNRLPGGVGSSVHAVSRLLDGPLSTVVDVGCGSADFARRLRRRRPARILNVDIRPDVLAVARERVGTLDGVTLLEGDARRLPLDDASVDVAHASLLLHHLDPPDVVAAFAEMRRVSRVGVVVNDLRRGPVAFAITAATVLSLTRGRYTRHDGVLSARRAYTLDEQDAFAAGAGLRVAGRSPAAWPRVTTVYR